MFDFIGLSDYKLHKLQERLFTLFIYFSYILYAVILLGLSTTAPKYLEKIHYIVAIYTGLFLVWRFNMFRHVRFTELDRQIAFYAGVFILSTTLINSIVINLPEIKSKLYSFF